MPGVDVNVWAAGDVQLLDHAVTDDDGQFEVTGLPEGVDLDVVASKLRGDHWLLQKQSRATVVPGRPCEMGDIHLGAMPPPISNPDTPEFYPRSQAARLSSAPASH